MVIGIIGFISSEWSFSQTAPKQPAAGNKNQAPAASGESDRFVSIDFNEVDINVFIKFISELTGKNFIVDQRVKGKVSVISPAKISVDEAFRVFESVLEVHGYTTVQSGKVIKIVPSPDARSKSIETRLKEEAAHPEDKVVTQLIQLRYADPDEIKRLFAPMISKSSVILSYSPTNTLIVTDVFSNIQRLTRILKAIDIAGIGQEISVIPLHFSDATKMVKLLSTVFKPTARTKKGQAERALQIVADERTNTIVLLASEVDSMKVKELVAMLDKETPRGKGKIHVYYLENATAEDLAKVLMELPTKGTTAEKGKEAPIVSKDVKVTADKATNSLIVMADKDDYEVIEEIIQKLDVPRSMVYIEALFMEVNVDAQFEVGIDWNIAGTTDVAGKRSVVSGGYSPDGTAGTLNAATALTNPTDFPLGLLSEPISIEAFGETFVLSNISAVLNAFETNDEVEIISTPQVMTMDNEEAKIVVATNIPFQTTTSTSDNDTYNSFEYRDVGRILSITPHISKGRMVRLKISLEVSTATDTTSLQPTTLKRTVDTTVVVQDENTIVIGGLIGDTLTDADSQVPILGSIPGLSWLFSKTFQRDQKTNLYIFITPHVVNNPQEAETVYEKKKTQIDGIRKGEIKLYEEIAGPS